MPAAVWSCLLLFGLLHLEVSPSDAEPWKLSGKAGVELDGIGETFGSGSLFDAGLPSPASTPEDPIQSEPLFDYLLQERTTNVSGLLDLSVEKKGETWFRSRSLLRGARTRTRGDLDLSGGSRTRMGDFSAENRLLFQGGPQAGGGWVDDLLNASWRKRRLPAGLELRVSAAGERSWAAADSLGDLFDYRVLRPGAELRRPLGLAGDLSARFSYGRKWARHDSLGSYRDRTVELECSQYLGLIHPWSLCLRTQSRSFVRSDSLMPSYREDGLEGTAEIGLPSRLRLRFEPKVRRLDYELRSALLQNHWTAEGTLKLEASLRDLLHPGEADTSVSTADWVFGAGGKIGLLRNERHDSDYHAASALLSVSREGSEDFWFDLAIEGGRRAYRSGGAQRLIIEGLDLSLFGSDYRFLSTSILSEVALARGIRCEIFGDYEREDHTQDADDLTLWTFTVSLTRSF